MKVRNSCRALIAALLAIAMLGSVLAPTASAIVAESGVRQVGEDGYISLHQYITPTSEEDIYKVTMQIELNNLATTFDMVFLLDAGEKMLQAADASGKTHFEYQVDAAYNAASILLDPGRNPHEYEGSYRARVFFVFYNGGVFGVAPGGGGVTNLMPTVAGTSVTNNVTSQIVAYFADGNVNGARIPGVKLPTSQTRELKNMRADLNAVVADAKSSTGVIQSATPLLSNNDSGTGTLATATSPGNYAAPKAHQEHYSAAALAAAYEIYAAYSRVEDGGYSTAINRGEYLPAGTNEGPDPYTDTTKLEPTHRKITIMLSADRDYEVRDPMSYVATPVAARTAGTTLALEPATIAQEGSLRAEAVVIAKALKLEVHNKGTYGIGNNYGVGPLASGLAEDTFTTAVTSSGGVSMSPAEAYVAKRTHEVSIWPYNEQVGTTSKLDPADTTMTEITYQSFRNTLSQTTGTMTDGRTTPFENFHTVRSGAALNPASGTSPFTGVANALVFTTVGGTYETGDQGDYSKHTNAGGHVDPIYFPSHWRHDTNFVAPQNKYGTLAATVGANTYTYVGWGAFNYDKDFAEVYSEYVNTAGVIMPYGQDDQYDMTSVNSPLSSTYQTILANGGMGAEIWTVGYETTGAHPNSSGISTSYDPDTKTLDWEGRRLHDTLETAGNAADWGQPYYTDLDASEPGDASANAVTPGAVTNNVSAHTNTIKATARPNGSSAIQHFDITADPYPAVVYNYRGNGMNATTAGTIRIGTDYNTTFDYSYISSTLPTRYGYRYKWQYWQDHEVTGWYADYTPGGDSMWPLVSHAQPAAATYRYVYIENNQMRYGPVTNYPTAANGLRSPSANYVTPNPITTTANQKLAATLQWRDIVTWNSVPDSTEPATTPAAVVDAYAGAPMMTIMDPSHDYDWTQRLKWQDTPTASELRYGTGTGAAPTLEQYLKRHRSWPVDTSGSIGGNHRAFNGVKTRAAGANTDDTLGEFLTVLAGTNRDNYQGITDWSLDVGDNAAGTATDATFKAIRAGWSKTWRERETALYPTFQALQRDLTWAPSQGAAYINQGSATALPSETTLPINPGPGVWVWPNWATSNPNTERNSNTAPSITWPSTNGNQAYDDGGSHVNSTPGTPGGSGTAHGILSGYFSAEAANGNYATPIDGRMLKNTNYANYAEGFEIKLSSKTYEAAVKDYLGNEKHLESAHHNNDFPTDYEPIVRFVASESTPTAPASTYGMSNLLYEYEDMIYDLYKMPGGDAVSVLSEYFDMVTSKPITTDYTSAIPDRYVKNGGTYTVNGKKTLNWHLVDVYSTTIYTLEFYVKMVPNDLDPSLFYALDADCYIMNFDLRTLYRHKAEKGNYVRYLVTKNFPNKYVQGNGDIPEELDDTVAATAEPTSLIGFFAIPYESYALPTEIAEVKVEENTLEMLVKDSVKSSANLIAKASKKK